MRVPKNEKKGDESLTMLADFLNLDFKPDTWRKLKQRNESLGLTLFSFRTNIKKRMTKKVPSISTEEGKALQSEIRKDLFHLLEGETMANKITQLALSESSRTSKPHRELAEETVKDLTNVYGGLSTLIEKINNLGLKTRWNGPLPANQEAADLMDAIYLPPRSRPSQRILEIRGSKWVVSSWPSTKNPREDFYSIIGASLENGTLPRLRRCPECPKYFVAGDLKRRFCSDGCKDNFHNKRRLSTGFFSENRKKVRKKKLNQARRLQEKGRLERYVIGETGLSSRILKRAGLFS